MKKKTAITSQVQPVVGTGCKNISIKNQNAITAFSPEAHLIFRSASLSLKQQGQYQHQEPKNNKDKREKYPSIQVDSLNERAYLQD